MRILFVGAGGAGGVLPGRNPQSAWSASGISQSHHRYAYRAGSAATTSMLRDMLKNGRIEADHIVGDMIARAREVGVSTPILQTAFTRLKCYEAQRDGSSGAGSSIPQ